MRKPAVKFNAHRLTVDLANRGLAATDLARLAGVSDKTVSRFLRSETQTAATAKKLAEALGYSVRRYVIPSQPLGPQETPE
jgi:transcriptional regulator with XRE-family HTH domain